MIKIPENPRVAVVGGGTGLSVLLRGLKEYTDSITAIVTVTDDGGSSGWLRRELGMVPPGDIRRCLVALAHTENLMEKVFQHRFQHGRGLKGHTLGNLLLTAMTEITGDFMTAVTEVSKILAVRGRVLPASLQLVTLGARMKDGTVVYGETAIRRYPAAVERVFVAPSSPQAPDEAVVAIREADLIVLGPGSLYTSVIPNLLVPAIRESLLESKAPRVYVLNIMTEHGETDGFQAEDHVKAIYEHVGEPCIDYMLVNSQALPVELVERYRREDAHPVQYQRKRIEDMGIKLIEKDLLGVGEVAWHDPQRLAKTLIEVLSEHLGNGEPA